MVLGGKTFLGSKKKKKNRFQEVMVRIKGHFCEAAKGENLCHQIH